MFDPFFFRVPPPPQSYPLSLHDALPIYVRGRVEPNAEAAGLGPVRARVDRVVAVVPRAGRVDARADLVLRVAQDRKSTRLNSSHLGISYAVFCLKKKKRQKVACQARASV